jgi:carboxyl-terminal processing protease
LLYPFQIAQPLRLNPGRDILQAVDELSITPEMPIETIQAAIREDINQKVNLIVRREKEIQPLEIKVSRKEIPLPSVTWRLHPDFNSVGIIKINIIASSTSAEILSAVEDLTHHGADRFILDLRDNGGGLLTESIDIARLFLTSGEILQQKYVSSQSRLFG